MISQKIVPKIKQIRNKALRRRLGPNGTSRAEAKEWGGGARLAGLGGSDWKGEKFEGSDENKGDLHADPVDRRILFSIGLPIFF